MKKFIILIMGMMLFEPAYAKDIYILARVNTTDIKSIADLGLDVVKVDKDKRVELVTNPNQLAKIKARGVNPEIVIEDMESYYSKRMASSYKSGKANDFGPFYTYSEANAILDSLHNQYPNIITARDSIGKTWNNNTIWAVKISSNSGQPQFKPEVYYDALHHAREPVGVNVVIEFIRYLCQNYGTDSTITDLVNNLQIWVVPIINPDGYLYNEQKYPQGGGMWRKNRRNNGGKCYGVDLNRNYGYEWGCDDVGSSPDSSNDAYRGPSAFSEPETQAIRDFCNKHRFVTGLSYHSYAGLLLFPWGYDSAFTTPDDSLFRRMAAAMTAQNGYPYGNCGAILYLANGGLFDWMYGEQTTKPKILCFSPEVAGSDFWDTTSIPQNLQECQPMNLYLLKYVRNLPFVVYLKYHVNDSLYGNGDGVIDAGETIALPLWVKNQGQTTGHSIIGTLRTDDPYVSILDSIKALGNIISGDSSSMQYSFKALAGCPNGHLLHFILYCKDTYNSVWLSDFYVPFGLEWANHNIGNVIFTVTCDGSCGFTEQGSKAGSGFIYPKNGKNQLSIGSLWVGNSKNWIANRDYPADPAQEWVVTTTPNGRMKMTLPTASEQDGWAMYQDTIKKVKVEQQSYSWSNKPYDDFVIMKYTIANNGDTAIKGLYAGQFMDFNVGGDSINSGSSDSTRKLVYMWRNGNPCVGVEILSQTDSVTNLSLIRNSTYLYAKHYIADSIKIKFLNGGLSTVPSDTTDWSLIASSGPFTLSAGDSTVFAIAVLGGDSLPDFRANADTARYLYKNIIGISENNKIAGKNVLFQNYPNPFVEKTVICYSLNESRNDYTVNDSRLTIYDMAGRLVKSFSLTPNPQSLTTAVEWDRKDTKGKRVASGLYFYKLKAGNFVDTKKLVVL